LDFVRSLPCGALPDCYGYPTAALVLSIVDTVGGFVVGGNVERHFAV
jgi:hypothetical protein